MKPDLEKLRALIADATPSLSVVQCWVSQEKADRQKDALLLKELPSLISYCEKLEAANQDKAEEIIRLRGQIEAQSAVVEYARLKFTRIEKLEAVAEAARDLVNYWPKDLGDGFHISEYCNSVFSPYYRPRDSLSLAEALQALDADAYAMINTMMDRMEKLEAVAGGGLKSSTRQARRRFVSIAANHWDALLDVVELATRFVLKPDDEDREDALAEALKKLEEIT